MDHNDVNGSPNYPGSYYSPDRATNHKSVSGRHTSHDQYWTSDQSAPTEFPNDPFLARQNYETRPSKTPNTTQVAINKVLSFLAHLMIVSTLSVFAALAVYMLWKDYIYLGSFIIETVSYPKDTEYEFPPVTICNKAMFNMEKEPYSSDSLLAAIRNATRYPANYEGLDKLSLRNENYFYASFSKRFGFDHGFSLDDYFIMCKYYNSPTACDLMFKPVFVPLLGLCYRSDISSSWRASSGPLLGMDVYFYFDRFEPSPLFGEGALILIGDHMGTENAIHLVKGNSLSLSVKEVLYEQESSYDSQQCRDFSEDSAEQSPAGSSVRYSVESCKLLCLNKLWHAAFGCFAHAGFYSEKSEKCMDEANQRVLTTEALTFGHSKLTSDLVRKQGLCAEQCFMPCKYKKYRFDKVQYPMKRGSSYVTSISK